MRIAVLADIHGNLMALKAVVADLWESAPDVVLNGGDLADPGSSPIEVLDWVRDLKWDGVVGNTDEMLVRPERLNQFARTSSAPPGMWTAIREIADVTRAIAGESRLRWISEMPLVHTEKDLALVHAGVDNCWTAPGDEEIEQAFAKLNAPVVVRTYSCSFRSRAGDQCRECGPAV